MQPSDGATSLEVAFVSWTISKCYGRHWRQKHHIVVVVVLSETKSILGFRLLLQWRIASISRYIDSRSECRTKCNAICGDIITRERTMLWRWWWQNVPKETRVGGYLHFDKNFAISIESRAIISYKYSQVRMGSVAAPLTDWHAVSLFKQKTLVSCSKL